MGKLTLLICLVFLVGSVISATTRSRSSSPNRAAATCGRHGDPCTGSGAVSCCPDMRCHPYAGRCQAIITSEELQNTRKRLRPVPKPKNY